MTGRLYTTWDPDAERWTLDLFWNGGRATATVDALEVEGAGALADLVIKRLADAGAPAGLEAAIRGQVTP